MHETLSANEAKTNFGTLLLKAQRTPVQFNRYGKAVAVVISVEDYERFENLKLQVLQMRAAQVDEDIAVQNMVDGEQFLDELRKWSPRLICKAHKQF